MPSCKRGPAKHPVCDGQNQQFDQYPGQMSIVLETAGNERSIGKPCCYSLVSIALLIRLEQGVRKSFCGYARVGRWGKLQVLRAWNREELGVE